MPNILAPSLLATATAIALVPALSVRAQEAAQPVIAACVAVENDALRLQCYDRAAGRGQQGPAQADAAAAEARTVVAAEPEVVDTLTPLGEVFQASADRQQLDAIANVGKGSLLDTRWELARDSKLGLFNFRVYKPLYLLPAFWTSDVNDTPSSPNPDNTVDMPQSLDSLETKFQISFKTKALENLFGDNGDVWMGYTQSSRWQVYNTDESRPFRETNYEPEVLLVFRNGYGLPGGWHGRMSAIGINHQSNGRGGELSRSWNRVVFNFGFDREDWALVARPWVHLKDGSDDDNPDIADYMGRGDLTLMHVRGDHRLTVMGRHSLRGGDESRGALQFDWGFPIHPGFRNFRGHLQLFHGYGESLIDYNHKATYIGLGISLQDWL
ncbi:phospholipase A [Luteimonas yindakuii]|uniref:phospholipase A n=1 Tax=Luteimonas yindakuii TaxID=2565782 RepID=UPI0010A40703|nr:phospholipase A [Luteimonas yindakuii]QCO68053.1 phospholipase A [Luteimonas yindakuii]